MAVIAYPFHVIHCGKMYAPHAHIEVEDAAEYVAAGAVVIDSTSPTPIAETVEKPKRSYKKRNGGE